MGKPRPTPTGIPSVSTDNNFPVDNGPGFFLASQQGISYMGKGKGLLCCLTKILLECRAIMYDWNTAIKMIWFVYFIWKLFLF